MNSKNSLANDPFFFYRKISSIHSFIFQLYALKYIKHLSRLAIPDFHNFQYQLCS